MDTQLGMLDVLNVAQSAPARGRETGLNGNTPLFILTITTGRA